MRLDDYAQRTDSKRVGLTDDEVRAFVAEAFERASCQFHGPLEHALEELVAEPA